MKKVIVIWGVLLFAHILSASENPLARTCKADGGKAKFFTDDKNQEIIICSYGTALVGAETMFNHKMDTFQSAIFFLTNEFMTIDYSCWQFAGKDIELISPMGFRVDFCLFEDGSLIGFRTVRKGIKSWENSSLKKALENTSWH